MTAGLLGSWREIAIPVPTAEAKRGGEEPWRVHRVGAPSLDHLRRSRLLTPEELQRKLGVAIEPGALLVAYHPLTIARDTLREADELYAALEASPGQVLFCFPNADAGSRELIRRAEAFCAGRSASRLFVNLAPPTYWSLLRSVGALLGNSSSGIMEAPSLALPVVNVGLRQAGRERARNILDAPAECRAIRAALERALDPAFRREIARMTSPYGDGRAAERIAAALVEAPLGERLLHKRPVPLATPDARVPQERAYPAAAEFNKTRTD